MASEITIMVIPEESDEREDFLSGLRNTEPQAPTASHSSSSKDNPQEKDRQNEGVRDVENHSNDGDSAPDYQTFKLTATGRLIFCALAVLTLMVALDGTSISVALPVFPLSRYSCSLCLFRNE